MSTPSFDPGIAGGKVVEVDLPINAGITATAKEAARTVNLDGWGHVVPPPGTETLGQALLDLPNDIGGWATGWLDGLGIMDWLDNLNITAMLAPLLHVLSGGMLQWITLGFLGIRIFSMGHNIVAGRGPVSLVYYTIPSATLDPVRAYLQHSAQVEIREVRPDDQGSTSLGIPIYHKGRADRGLAHLNKRTGLVYSTLG